MKRWFGSSKDEVWADLARQVDGTFVEGSLFKDSKVEVRTGEWTVTLDTFIVPAGNVMIPYTRMRAPFVNRDGFRFKVYRKGMLSGLGRMFGMQDIEVGEPRFDDAFIVKGNDEAKVRSFFADAAIREALLLQSEVSFEVKDDEKWFGQSFPEGVDELYFQITGEIKEIERLKALFDLFAMTLDRLCEIGSAYEDNPNITL